MSDTKIALIVREDIAVWQKLNVTAFLMSGITAEYPDILGAPYIDASGYQHLRLAGQPVIVLSGDGGTLQKTRRRANERGVTTAIYIEEMFATGDDDANRAVFAKHSPEEDNVVGIALCAQRKIVDKIIKSTRMHS